MSYKNWSLKKKFNSANLLIVALFFGFAIFNFYEFQTVVNRFDVIVEEMTPKLQKISDMKGYVFSASTQAALLAQDNASLEQRKEWESELDDRIEKFEVAFESFKNLNLDKEELAFFETIKSDWIIFKEASLNIKQYKKNNSIDKNSEVKILLNQTIENKLNDLFSKLSNLTEDVNTDLKEESEIADKNYADSKIFALLLVLFISAITFLIGFYNGKIIEDSINQVIKNLSNSSNKVASGSQTVATAATELSSITNTQSSALEQTSSASAEINSMIEKNIELLQESKNLSETSFQKGQEGQEAMSHLLHSIELITEGNNQIENQIIANNQKMEEIILTISNINDRTKVINDIVFQTKLLSFNASVEAARAGEAGKGFAVVAEEVGNLAQMSGKASQDISQLLEASSEQVKKIITISQTEIDKLMINSKKNIEQGVQTSQLCAGLIEEMVEQSKQILNLSESIDSASSEQAKGVHEISSALSSLSHANNEILTASENSAKSAEDLSKEANELDSFVHELSRVVYGAEFKSEQKKSTPAENVKTIRPKHKVA